MPDTRSKKIKTSIGSYARGVAVGRLKRKLFDKKNMENMFRCFPFMTLNMKFSLFTVI